MHRPAIPLICLLLAAIPRVASAADGALEINHSCAAQTGCFAGDTAGYPVTIDGTAGRSYRLTSGLTIPNQNTDGIVVSANDVAIDLNGFGLFGSVSCTGSPVVVCAPAGGTGVGIRRTASTIRGLSVRDGSVVGMGGRGVWLGEQGEATGLRVRSNGNNGIEAGLGSVVAGNAIHQNGNNGIFATAAVISNNGVTQNAASGITTLVGSVISDNSVGYNGQIGIFASTGAKIEGNSTLFNGQAGNASFDDGISCSSGCLIRANTARDNAGHGISLGIDSAYADNVVTGNLTGTVGGTGSGNNRGGNYCAGTGLGTASCP